ncbi:MAG: hypothetical protein B6I26_03380 [Desulfobacteraceae bacterium 4572_130]|nr:MAG: hypothetical protein B6I26_03380 [Desulfobacteraceae bacterium 4572_130]
MSLKKIILANLVFFATKILYTCKSDIKKNYTCKFSVLKKIILANLVFFATKILYFWKFYTNNKI